jgi:hypothetical protein
MPPSLVLIIDYRRSLVWFFRNERGEPGLRRFPPRTEAETQEPAPFSNPSFLQSLREKPPFDPLARPGRFPQKREAGLHAWVMEETADRDATPHLGPPMTRNQLADNGLQRDAVQWIVGMGDGQWLAHAVSAS